MDGGRGGEECGRSTRGVWYRLPAASGDLAISKGSRMPLRELDVTPGKPLSRRVIARNSAGCNGPGVEGGVRGEGKLDAAYLYGS